MRDPRTRPRTRPRASLWASPWAHRAAETFAILTIGDAVIELVAPRRHSLLWEAGPEGVRRVARFFAANPNLMRLLGLAQLGFGLWLAGRQYREP